MNLLILVVDDEPDVELLFRQQFRHDLRADLILECLQLVGSRAGIAPFNRTT